MFSVRCFYSFYPPFCNRMVQTETVTHNKGKCVCIGKCVFIFSQSLQTSSSFHSFAVGINMFSTDTTCSLHTFPKTLVLYGRVYHWIVEGVLMWKMLSNLQIIFSILNVPVAYVTDAKCPWARRGKIKLLDFFIKDS